MCGDLLGQFPAGQHLAAVEQQVRQSRVCLQVLPDLVVMLPQFDIQLAPSRSTCRSYSSTAARRAIASSSSSRLRKYEYSVIAPTPSRSASPAIVNLS